MDSSVHIREWGEDSSTEEEALDSVVSGLSNVRRHSTNAGDDGIVDVRSTSRSSLNNVASVRQEKEQPSVPSQGEQATETNWQEENTRLKRELDEARSLVMVAQCTLEESIDSERRKCREEIATLQQLMRENVAEAVRSTQSRFETEIRRLKSIVMKLENENQELKAQDKEGSNVLTTVTKTLARKATMALSSSPSVDDNLEHSMKRAQEDVEVLRSLVLPLEEEIKALKDKLRTADDQLRMHEAMQADMVKNSEALGAILQGTPLPDVLTQLDEKLNEVSSNLKAEKSSRADLEMYVTILRTQKTVLQEDRDRLKSQLQEVCRHLEQERRAHRELRRTWQQANDQFLETQREHSQELLAMQAILTPEQQQQYAEMKQLTKAKADCDNKTPVSMKDKLSLAKEKLSLSPLFNRISPVLKRKSPTSTPSKMGASRENSPNRAEERVVPLSKSPPNLVNLEVSDENVVEKQAWFNINGQSLHDSVREETMSLLAETPMSHSNSWTGLMELAQPTNDDLWPLQDESFDTKTTVSQPCSMCANYEAQLQRAQEDAAKTDKLSKAMQKDLDKARQDLAGMTQLVKDMEAKWTEVAQDYEKQVTSLFSQTETLQRNLSEAKQLYRDYRQQAQESLKELTYDRERVNKELVRLQQENEDLVGKHSVRAEELQNEIINLPNNLQDMQFLLLKWREDLIAAKVAKEAIENQLKSQLLFLKDQVLAEQQAKEQLEDSLTCENDHLRQELGILRSVQTQLEDESNKKQKLEKKLHECLAKLNELERSYREVCEAKAKAEQEVLQMRSKVASLQADMETSETVQRDFVKLSQSLQVQLERIRQSEKELRWQHEEDVEDCSECKQPFSVTKRKHHCRHCGHIFCADCLRKTVYSGPQRRPNKVCNVCHYLLVQDSAPFFSTEPPHTPV